MKTTKTTKVTRTTLKANSRQPTTTTNILSSKDLDPGTSIIIYMTVLISTFVLMPVIILCLRGVGKMFKLKRTRTLSIFRELSLFNFDVDSEEHVVFDVTASYTAISRKVVAKTVHVTIPKGNMGYDQYTCS